MNVFQLFGELKLEDAAYQRSLNQAERKTDTASRNMQRSWDQRLGRMQDRLDTFGRSAQRIGGGLSKGLTAPIVAMGAAAFVAAGKLGNAADRLLDLEQMTGLSTDTLQEFENVARAAGVSSEVLSGAAEGLTRRLRAAGPESKTFSDNIEALGVSTRNADGSLRNMDDLVPEIVSSLSGMDNITERNAVSMQLFGRRATELAPVLALGSDEIARLSQEAHDMGQVMSREALTAANEYRIEMAQLKAEFGIAAREVTQSLLPIMKSLAEYLRSTVIPVVQGFADKVEGLFEWFQEASEGTKRFIGIVVGGLAAAGPATLAFGVAARAVSGLIGVVRTLRALMLTTAGPVGWIALIAAAVGVTLVRAYGKYDRAVQTSIDKGQAMVDAIGTPTDKDALRGRLDELASHLADSEQTGFKVWAENAITQAETVGEAYETVTRYVLEQMVKVATAAEQARLEVARDALRDYTQDELDIIGQIDAATAAIESGYRNLQRAEEQGDESLANAIAGRIEELYLARDELQGRASEVMGGARSSVLQGILSEISELELAIARKRAEISGGVEVAPFRIETTVVPDPDVEGATDSDPTGLQGLAEDGITIPVRLDVESAPRAALPTVTPDMAPPIPDPPLLRGSRTGARVRPLGPSVPGVPRMALPGVSPGMAPLVPELDPFREAVTALTLAVRGAREGFGPVRPPGPREGFGPVLPPLVEEPGRSNIRPVLREFGPRGEREGFGTARPPLVEEPGRTSRFGPLGEREGFGGLPPSELGPRREEAGGQFQQGEREESAFSKGAKALGGSLLDLAKDKVPLVGTALAGFAQGPVAGVTAIIGELLDSSEAWKGVQEIFTEILTRAAEALEPLIGAVLKLLDALWPIIDVAITLIEVGLMPLVWILETIVAPVFEWVARLIAGIWNFIAGIFRLEKIDLEGDAPRPPPSEVPSTDTGTDTDTGGTRDRREVGFGGTPQAVQLAVATPLVDAAYTMREAVEMLVAGLPDLSGSGPESFTNAFGGHVATFGEYVDRLVQEGIRIQVGQAGGRAGSGTAHLRTI